MELDGQIKELRLELAKVKEYFEDHCETKAATYDRRLSSLLTKIDDDVIKIYNKIEGTRKDGIKAWLLLGGLLLGAVAWASIKFDNIHVVKEVVILNGARIAQNGDNIERMVKSLDMIVVDMKEERKANQAYRHGIMI